MATKYITLTNLGTFLGQLKDNYKATDSNFGGIKLGYSQNGKNYPVQLDSSNKAFVNVPWQPGSFSLSTATSSALGGVKIGYNGNKTDATTDTYKAPLLLSSDTNNEGRAYVELSVATTGQAGLMSATDKTRLNGIEEGANKYSLPKATRSSLGGVQIGSNITVGSGVISLDSSNVIGALGYTPANAEGNTSSGGGMVNKKWSELKTMRTDGKLSPGTKYRITDYVATVRDGLWSAGAESAGAESAGVGFDIIVEALTANTLSENAKACLHENDSYFKNCNLNTWELKYCFDNNTKRFEWADNTSGEGRGVIYYMKDEWGNEASYDFKGIKVYSNSSSINRFTFTLNGSSDSADHSLTGKVRNNVIKPWRSYAAGEPYYFINQISLSGETIEDNYFSYNCSKIDINGGTNSSSLVLANKFNDSCDFIYIYGDTIVHNTFGNYCTDMTLNDSKTKTSEISYNTFGNNCRYITAGNNFRSNTFGNNCDNFVVKHNFMKNVIGNNCSKWLFGHHCMKNTMVSNNYFAHLDPNYGDPVVLDYNYDIVDYRDNAYYYESPYACIYYCKNTDTSTMIPLCYVCNCVFDQNSHVKIRLENDFITSNNMDTDNMTDALRNYIFINLNNGFFDNADGDYDTVVDVAKIKKLLWYDSGDLPDNTGIYHCPQLNEPEITYVSLNSSGKIVRTPSSILFGYFQRSYQ